jgi:3-oxoacyl-[acyl-carrier-protein] synthase II
LSAAGSAVELIASILAMRHGILPRTLNYATPDPACAVAVTTTPRPIKKPYFVKLSLTEYGQAAAAVFKRWE